MTSVQIKGVPARTHAVLRQRAAARHQSLQEYLLSMLIAAADQKTMDELLDEVEARAGGVAPVDEVVDLLRADRAGR